VCYAEDLRTPRARAELASFDNIVVMGMGEPLANYDALIRALTIVNAEWGLGFGARRITVSTSGLAPKIERLAGEPLGFRLAVSLHGATDEVRGRIMPVNKAYPLAKLLPAVKAFTERHGRMATLEFILIEDVNDSLEQARALRAIALDLHAHVNLIPYNSVEGLPWRRPDAMRRHRRGVRPAAPKNRARAGGRRAGRIRFNLKVGGNQRFYVRFPAQSQPGSPPAKSMIEVKGLTKSFGAKRAVDGVSFSVRKGDILGFLGPNGAGKSTTMKMITGFLRPDSGTALTDGIDVLEDPVAVKRRLGYLPENAPAYPEMTVIEFLGFIAEVRGFSGGAARERVERAVCLTHLDSVRAQTIDTLSKGFKQRVGFAQALLHDPPTLVLDEPTDGLDPNQKNEMRLLIKGMAAQKAVILSTHILEEVEAICTRIIIISRGRLVADETPAALLARRPGARMDEIFRGLTEGDV
jgi:ABC-2 type transport system ATP-binding protein